ncbi:MAG: hypothetical protein A2Z99_18580 [Treponema sp. GWB1_62_6]|nr:MAG: hypothetical protein A2Y36_09220 [Treponema sp. GWA1_62_8]OHE64526.1 MAG: hypothetical protein A2001_03190 [Treponema sp. GWC1_61_84]OHE64996.1 MAG: hypothetical protein A2Z99_18580 [Treponema sp. GWB1_62_6]HCM25117.1 hypothetical protein [Treponema sp.]
MKRRMLATLLIFVFSAAVSTAAAFAQGRDVRFGVDFFVGTPSASSDIFRAVFPGVSLRYRHSGRIEFSLDYAFMDFEYYYPESPSGPWMGPVDWSSMPSRFDKLRGDWIFYQTKHFIAPQVWYIASLERYGQPLAIRLGAGPAFSLVIPSESAKFYPGLADAYEQFKKDFDIHPGWSFRLGLEYKPWRAVRLGAEYLFVIDSVTSFASDIGVWGTEYLDRSGNVLIFAGVRI